MKDTLYQLLNHDATELPTAEPISDQEVMNIMKRFKEESHTPSVKTKRKPKLSVVLLAAAVSAACVGTATVAAAKLGVFGTLSHQAERTFDDNGTERPIDKWADHYDYEQIAENAVEVSEALIGEGENLVVEVDEVYCDGVTTLISLSGHLKDGNPDHKQQLKFYPMTAHWGNVDYSQDGYDTADLSCDLILDEETDNEFSGDLKIVDFGNKEITEPGLLEIHVETIREMDNYLDCEEPRSSGGFTLSVPVTPDRSLRIGADNAPYTIEEDGYSVVIYEISPAMMIVGSYPKEADCMVYRENGEVAEFIGLRKLPEYNGMKAGCMTPTRETLTFSFFDKSAEPDENGHFSSMKEITVNMDEVYAALSAE
ncbi:MAG: hypothetical protein IJ055_01510 [Oscillospiraceae bacterium]|nr:hypothetical protein [Oscillospiraceae bacterium]